MARKPRERRASSSYGELLRDPRWQRKRLEIYERDGWACLSCAATDKTLNVHHRRYDYGKQPWDYEDDNFETLCEDCHRKATDITKRLKLAMSGLWSGDLIEVLGYVQGMMFRRGEGTDTKAESYEHAMGIGAALGLTAEELIMRFDGVVTQNRVFAVEYDEANKK